MGIPSALAGRESKAVMAAASRTAVSNPSTAIAAAATAESVSGSVGCATLELGLPLGDEARDEANADAGTNGEGTSGGGGT